MSDDHRLADAKPATRPDDAPRDDNDDPVFEDDAPPWEDTGYQIRVLAGELGIDFRDQYLKEHFRRGKYSRPTTADSYSCMTVTCRRISRTTTPRSGTRSERSNRRTTVKIRVSITTDL